MAGEKDILALLGSPLAVGIPAPGLPFPGRGNVSQPEPVQGLQAAQWEQGQVHEGFFPLSLETASGKRFDFPVEPLVSISGKNKIARRQTAKKGEGIGTIKEYWSTDDWTITIKGLLYGPRITGAPEQTYPRMDLEALRDILLTPESLRVYCEPLQLLGINRLVIESFQFPFTKGENVQAYVIKAYSDFTPEILLEIKNNE